MRSRCRVSLEILQSSKLWKHATPTRYLPDRPRLLPTVTRAQFHYSLPPRYVILLDFPLNHLAARAVPVAAVITFVVYSVCFAPSILCTYTSFVDVPLLFRGEAAHQVPIPSLPPPRSALRGLPACRLPQSQQPTHVITHTPTFRYLRWCLPIFWQVLHLTAQVLNPSPRYHHAPLVG
ncbi:hypothetical protein B0T19DRAFT_222725 [Cercophora scortea]|uniref:Uncharacterized protein n=1 Tax=Cercophora scortea TaxID=314031 RepID=A0AAE0IFB0_9PEZI|nr:hypothetical protein B0T19DRAFT_222725 [Cercophora scortea]